MLGEVAETPGTILSEEGAPRRNGQTAFEGSIGRLLKGLKGALTTLRESREVAVQDEGQRGGEAEGLQR